MFKEAIIKQYIGCLALIITASSIQSCKDNNKDTAIDLYSQAETYYNAGEYNKSILLLDSLKKNFTDDIDLLRNGLHLRMLANEGLIKAEILHNDSIISELESENKMYSSKFKYIKHKDMVEGFYVHNSIVKDIERTEKNTIEPRIDENDMFYLVSYLTGHDIKHTSIIVSTNSNSVTSSIVPFDKAQNYRYSSDDKTYEIVTFNNNQCDTIGEFIANNENYPIKVTFQGKKSYSLQLDKKEITAIAETYRYTTNKNKGKSAIKNRIFLEKKLNLAEKQIEQTKINK